MIVPHRQLEECRRNPASWARSKLPVEGQQNSHPYQSYDNCIRMAIYRFHKDGQPQASKLFLARLMDRLEFTNSDRTEDALHRLDRYIGWFEAEGVTVVNWKVRVRLHMGFGFNLGGEIGRVDVTEQGYLGVLLEPMNDHWERELRMPLIQRALAATYGRPEEEFSIGMQELDASDFRVRNFSKSEMNDAFLLAAHVAQQVMSYFPPQNITSL